MKSRLVPLAVLLVLGLVSGATTSDAAFWEPR